MRSEQRSLREKELPPFGLRTNWAVAALLVGYSPLAGMRTRAVRKHLAPCHSPIGAQQTSSHLRDTTLGLLYFADEALDGLTQLIHGVGLVNQP